MLFAAPVGAQVVPRAAGGGAAAAGGATEATLLTRASEATLLLVETDTTTIAAATHLEDVPHVTGDRGMALWTVRNEALAALSFTNLDYTPIGTTRSGQVLGVPYHNASATGALQISKLEDSPHGSGDAGIPAWGVSNISISTRGGSDSDYIPISVENTGTVFTMPRVATGIAVATQLGKLEDTLHVSGDAGVPAWGIRNEDATVLTDAEDDYGAIAISRDGKVIGIPTHSTNLAATFQIGKREDSGHLTADVGVAALTVQNETLATLTAVGLEYGVIATERSGIVIGSLVAGNLADSVRLAKLEDAPSGGGHPGMPAMGVINVTTSIKAADGDYTFLALARSGASLGVPIFEGTVDSSFRATHREDTPHVTGDAGLMALGVRNESSAILAVTQGDYSPFATDRAGRVFGIPSFNSAIGNTVQLGKAEDSVAAGSDAGIFDLGVVNTGFTTLAAIGDYVGKAHTSQGLYLTSLVLDTTLGDARVPVKNEDTVSGGGMAGIATLGIRNEGFVQLAGANLDYIQFATDKEGRTFVRSMDAILIEELVELIGINENVANTQYGASVSVALAASHSGELLKSCLTTTEDGAGSILTPAGTLFILDAATANAVGAAAITAVERLTVLAQITYAAADWQSDANGGSNCKVIADGFHVNGTLHALWFHEDATAFNDVAGDDEQLELAFWYRRDS